ncbi:hypothetical protein [Massilia consociata]|uniref:Response regulatory domain-containing protein n=1 Tax=Massilia consociata TaxID=760117 RepID=A0ABV6FDG6_9BURK
MKCALVLEKDQLSSGDTSRLLKSLGYVPAAVRTPAEALNVASALDFDVIITCTSKIPDDRRSLAGELKRLAPEAAVILVQDDASLPHDARPGYAEGISGVLHRPIQVRDIRQIVEFGIDGCGMQPAYLPPSQDRRRRRAIVR